MSIGSFFLILWGLGVPLYFFKRAKTSNRILIEKKTRIHFVKNKKLSVSSIVSEKNIFQESENIPATFISNKEEKFEIIPSAKNSRDFKEEDSRKINLNLFFVSGYEPKFFFWEAVVFLKKALIIVFSFLMSYLDKRSVTSFMVIIFLTYFLINERWKIYISLRIKRLESLSLVVAVTTITFGLFSSLEDVNDVTKLVALGLVVLSNIYFFSVGIRTYLLIRNDKRRNILENSFSKKKFDNKKGNLSRASIKN
jgi:hypothetical protein